MDINLAQIRTEAWMKEQWGEEHLKNRVENGLRMLEEALEVAQALAVSEELVQKVTRQVYDKPVGDIRQEIAGTFINILRICHVEQFLLEDVYEHEQTRIEKPEVMSQIKEKQAKKVKAY